MQLPSGTWQIRGPAGTLDLLPGSRVARIAGVSLWLGFAPTLLSNTLVLHPRDWEKNVRPLVTPKPEGPARKLRIVLDPGHGGQDSGTHSVIGPGQEKDYTLDWARRMEPLLQAAGWEVILTRSEDKTLSLAERVALADRVQADLFLSLHFNSAAPDTTHRGLETYCLTPVGLPSTLTRNYADPPDQSFPNNAFDDANLRLATSLHAALIRATQAEDRGIRRARFMAVLRDQRRPAALIEGGYLSNPEEARQIEDPHYRQLLAETLTRALLESHGSTLAPTLTPP